MLQIKPAIIQGFTEFNARQIEHVIGRLNRVLSLYDVDIQCEILDHRDYDGELGFDQSDENNIWIYKRLISGSERGSYVDGVWQAKIYAYYKRWSRAVAYTNFNEDTININMAKYDLSDEVALVETLIHEYCHLVGMVHSFRRSHLWPTTAPHAIGKIVAMYYVREYGIQPKQPIEFRMSMWSRVKSFFGRVF